MVPAVMAPRDIQNIGKEINLSESLNAFIGKEEAGDQTAIIIIRVE